MYVFLQIYVDEQPHQGVRSSSRTKALVHGLQLDSTFDLAIESNDGGIGVAVSARQNIRFTPLLLGEIAKNTKPPPIPDSSSSKTNKCTL